MQCCRSSYGRMRAGRYCLRFLLVLVTSLICDRGSGTGLDGDDNSCDGDCIAMIIDVLCSTLWCPKGVQEDTIMSSGDRLREWDALNAVMPFDVMDPRFDVQIGQSSLPNPTPPCPRLSHGLPTLLVTSPWSRCRHVPFEVTNDKLNSAWVQQSVQSCCYLEQIHHVDSFHQ